MRKVRQYYSDLLRSTLKKSQDNVVEVVEHSQNSRTLAVDVTAKMDAIMNAVGAKSELELLHMSAWTMLACGVAAFVGLQFMAAPYGRFADSAGKMFGFFMNGKVAWLLQEAPAFLLPAFFWFNEARDSTSDSAVRRLSPNTVLLSMFLLHYVHRAFIFPFRINGGKPTPFGIFLMAFVFCVWNG